MTDDMGNEIGPGLYVVATPLGNAGDLSPRARMVLAGADLILAEDTRRSGLLFKRIGLEREGGLVSLFEHNEEKRIGMVLRVLDEDKTVALISDAGTPLLSDPGFRVVAACRENDHPVIPVPGPCAPVAALSVSGLPPYPFTFLGFPPRKHIKVVSMFSAHAETGATLVFFERKDRLAATLGAAYEALGDRMLCIAREMTKTHEEFIYGTLAGIDKLDLELRGEITVIIGPGQERAASIEVVWQVIEEERELGGKPKEVARRAADRLRGWTAKAVYEKMMEDGR